MILSETDLKGRVKLAHGTSFRRTVELKELEAKIGGEQRESDEERSAKKDNGDDINADRWELGFRGASIADE